MSRFIDYLYQLKEAEDRAPLAEMRRGLNDFPHIHPRLLRYVNRFVPASAGEWEANSYYLIAALFASHPQPYERKEDEKFPNLGRHFQATLDPSNEGANVSTERRFTVLLEAHPEDLHFHLRQAVSFLRSKEQPIDWKQLHKDIRAWRYEDGRARVQKNWANQFWQRKSTTEE